MNCVDFMKQSYEFTREIFNQCSNNQMRDVFIEERDLSLSDIEQIIAEHCTGSNVEITRSTDARGIITADIVIDGLRQKLTFCP